MRNMKVALTCDNCGKEYRVSPSVVTRNKSGHHFCSHLCYLEKVKWVNAKGKYVACAMCGKEIWRPPRRLRLHKNHYCSMECLGRARGEKPESHASRWIGGRHKTSAGYVRVQASRVPPEFHSMLRGQGKHSGGDVLEHRLVMAQQLGRPLEPWEVVHHVNGVKDDNRIENLELHPEYDHIGITNTERTETITLKRENRTLKAEIARLKRRLEELGEEA